MDDAQFNRLLADHAALQQLTLTLAAALAQETEHPEAFAGFLFEQCRRGFAPGLIRGEQAEAFLPLARQSVDRLERTLARMIAPAGH